MIPTPIRRSLLAILTILSIVMVSGCRTAAPLAGASASAVPHASAIAEASPSHTAAEPPSASLGAEGGDRVTGQLGTFTWGDGGSDSPWLPGSPVTVGSGEPLSVTLAEGGSVTTWSARRVAAGTTDGSNAVSLGSGVAPIAFPAPERGSWSVQVIVGFSGDAGSATYYWDLTVR